MGNTIFHAIEHLHGIYYVVTHVPGLDPTPPSPSRGRVRVGVLSLVIHF
jgi:hypothetical protein